MIPLVADNKQAVIELCKHNGVQKLALFGSAATGDFDPETSDLDFVLEFADYGPGVARSSSVSPMRLNRSLNVRLILSLIL